MTFTGFLVSGESRGEHLGAGQAGSTCVCSSRLGCATPSGTTTMVRGVVDSRLRDVCLPTHQLPTAKCKTVECAALTPAPPMSAAIPVYFKWIKWVSYLNYTYAARECPLPSENRRSRRSSAGQPAVRPAGGWEARGASECLSGPRLAPQLPARSRATPSAADGPGSHLHHHSTTTLCPAVVDNEFNGATLYTGEGTAVHGSTLVPHSVSNGLSGEWGLSKGGGAATGALLLACQPPPPSVLHPAAVRASAAASLIGGAAAAARPAAVRAPAAVSSSAAASLIAAAAAAAATAAVAAAAASLLACLPPPLALAGPPAGSHPALPAVLSNAMVALGLMVGTRLFAFLVLLIMRRLKRI